MSDFTMIRDNSGETTYCLPFCEHTFSVQVTSAGGVASLTLPNTGSSTNVWAVLMASSSGGNFYVAKNKTPVIPTASFAEQAGELNPSPRVANGGDVLNFITSDTIVDIQVSLYAISR